jgi:TrmH family RNA methyltransferase
VAALATRRVLIPMPGGMESLNVGVAAGVCLFEQLRQQRFGR